MENTNMLKKLAIAGLMLAAFPSQAAKVKYYHLDALGSVRVVTDQAGAVVERHDYLPFGEECTTGPCATNPGSGGGEPKKFTGKERDSETGLDYFGARYYGAKTGRFTTIDPVYTWNENLLDPQRWNRYAYVRNNPLRFVDPDGREIGLALDAQQEMVLKGQMTQAQYEASIGARFNGAVGGITTLAALVLPGPEDFLLARLLPRLGRLGKVVDDVVDVTISRRKSPQAAKHIDDAQAAGHPDVVTIDRTRTRPNRKESLKRTEPQKGMDRDEYPPACCAEGGAGASVRKIPSGDNRSAGGQLGQQIQGLPNGARVRIGTKDQ